jgi:radical SAM protein with 4Fe4S-binding SPASM domain
MAQEQSRIGLRRLPLAPAEERAPPLDERARSEDERWRPVAAVWELTLRCDHACNHCGSRAGAPRHGELSTDECLKLVGELDALGVRELSLIGGEAYLHPGWLDVIREATARGMQVALVTGGRGITRECAESARRAGLVSANVSIDGLRNTHDALRGVRGSFDSARAAMAYLREAGVRVAMSTQVGRPTLVELDALADIAIEERVHAWQVSLTVAMGRAADHPELLLQPYDMLTLVPLVARAKERCGEAGVRLVPGSNVGYFGPYEEILRGDMPLGHLYSCGAGRTSIGIEADGTIKGCPSLPTAGWAGGNVRREGLSNVWKRSPRLRYTRDRTVADLWGFCRTCYYADECRAGCTWTGTVLFGRPGNNPYCHHRALELAERGQRERLVATHRAPGLPFDTGRFELVVESMPEMKDDTGSRRSS